MSLATLRSRPGTWMVTLVGTACVVGVLVSMLSLGAGARALLMQNARADRVWVLSHGAQALFDSSIPKQVRRRILEASVRAPEDWHQNAIRAAYSSGDKDWMLTGGVFDALGARF